MRFIESIKKKYKAWIDYKNLYMNIGAQLRKDYDLDRAKKLEVKSGNRDKRK